MAETLTTIVSTDTIQMTRHSDGAWKKLAKSISDLGSIDDHPILSETDVRTRDATALRPSSFLDGAMLEQWFTTTSSFEIGEVEFFRSGGGSAGDFVDIINRLAWPQMNQRRHDLLRKRHAGETPLTLAEARELGELQGALDVQLEPHFRSANQALDKIIARLEERSNDGQRDTTAD